LEISEQVLVDFIHEIVVGALTVLHGALTAQTVLHGALTAQTVMLRL